MEDRLPGVLQAVDDGTALGDPDALEVLRDCLAVHMARSRDLAALDDVVWRVAGPAAVDRLAARLAGDPRVADSFRLRHSGLEPAGREALVMEAKAIAGELLGTSTADVEASSFRADRMLDLYQQARHRLDGAGVEIGVAREGEFLISDAPAQSLKAGHRGVGPRGGVPWSTASTIVMPIGRRAFLGVGPQNAYFDIDRAQVDQMNRMQIASAYESVAWHPDADLLSFVRATLSAAPQ
jgi:hypothetical protein